MTDETQAAPQPAKDAKNGVTRPKSGTKTGRVWEIADAQSANRGKPALRKDVIAECVSEQINEATAATQYGRWRKYNGLEGRGTEEEEATPATAA